ncbi:hypothetical protein CSC2_24690 [Clostridium zeae]|uniref:HAMP domain-containing protein n=1 Tax=Clostridium zeae TaxID=2759022 RepID=A0ABQ1EAW8_9CLOT|nr:sensor histidine kinase [Clostridium zeae]GFZ31943.1 hypothetical protein CSC2_24690 [Clostridium zeae]
MKNSLRRKFIIFALIIIIPLATSNITAVLTNRKINDNYSIMLSKLNNVNEIKNLLNDASDNFNKYIQTNTTQCRDNYRKDLDGALNKVNSLRDISDVESQYILRDLINTLYSYRAEGEKTIELYDNRGPIDTYYDHYVSTKEIQTYCNSYITNLTDSYISYNDTLYKSYEIKERNINKIIMIYIAAALLMSILSTLVFIRNISLKLKQLVKASKKVSNGDFEMVGGEKTDIYELDLLSEAFNSMIKNIKVYINSLKRNAELERKVIDDEITILKYENALKLSQLKVLQSQINPHFLFNTLNCINQTAIKENASTTEELIKSVSGILRYSLTMMERNATLKEEIDVVKQYIFIQKVRYDERVTFMLDLKVDLTKVKVPGMTLQPFVENAFIHGIEPKEEGGKIGINIYEEGSYTIVLIEDSGCGFDEETLSKISSEDNSSEHIGHTTGMGIRSTINRLELLYDEKNLFSIESKKGLGTKIYLKIPKKVLM